MKLLYKCPFCGSDNCERDEVKQGDWKGRGIFLKCKNGMQCVIDPSVWMSEENEIAKRYHQMFLFLKEHPFAIKACEEYDYRFFYEEKTAMEYPQDFRNINVAKLMRTYPKSFMDRMEKSLYNLSKEYPVYGEIFLPEYESMIHLLYCEIQKQDDNIYDYNENEIKGILDILCDLGYLKSDNHTEYDYRITSQGWKKISEMEHTESSNQGFIAMAFSSDTEDISKAFKNAINNCGYIPRRIDEKEHNNQIVPEILFEISRSKFVVVDITVPNFGAYYEAGYAEALGKEVIICCRDKEFNGENKPHFDIAQKSTIVWKDIEDLENRLNRRIEATVGLN